MLPKYYRKDYKNRQTLRCHAYNQFSSRAKAEIYGTERFGSLAALGFKPTNEAVNGGYYHGA